VGVVAAEPLRSIGLVSILEETLGVQAVSLTLEDALADDSLAALVLNMPGPVDAVLSLLARVDCESPGLKVLVMGGPIDLEQVQILIGAGAKGFLPETVGEQEIRMAMEVILDGSIWAPRKVLARLIEEAQRRSAGNAPSPGSGVDLDQLLTAREREVLRLLMNGRSNREIASVIGVEPSTVKAHLGRMMRKTGATNRVELSLQGMEHAGKR
jgi:DNA-binding NarL/FixJ family response regulator